MRDDDFTRLLERFTALDRSMIGDDALELRPGNWLRSTLGLTFTSVGLAYGDGVWAARLLNRVDTRSAGEMGDWDLRSARGWLRRNLLQIPTELRRATAAKTEPRQRLDRDFWIQIVQSLDFSNVGLWGPGVTAQPFRMYRVQALFVLTRFVAIEVGPHSAFSFMIGSNTWLAGESPLRLVAGYGTGRFEDALAAAESYLGGPRWS